jgi:hypothetical protein
MKEADDGRVRWLVNDKIFFISRLGRKTLCQFLASELILTTCYLAEFHLIFVGLYQERSA